MRPNLILLALLVVPTFAARAGTAEPAASRGSETPDQRLVLVELFTSQGCSSCPPADRLLAQMSRDQRERVVTLAFHVDYWNRLGWRDPFSAAQWTLRQQVYSAAHSGGRVYTPQVVVDGSADLVGSDATALRAAVAAAAARPGARIAITTPPGTASAAPVRLLVTRPESLRSRRLVLMVALYEDGLETVVKSGENARRTLRNERVVRTLISAIELPAGGAAEAAAELMLPLDPDWARERLGVAAFLQDPETLIIEGAASATVPASRTGVAARGARAL